ncbi:Uncharacterised protein [Mycobacterium tuberculosis]|nr:Uncharacterised protein [Mycobacterium tuberculosis]
MPQAFGALGENDHDPTGDDGAFRIKNGLDGLIKIDIFGIAAGGGDDQLGLAGDRDTVLAGHDPATGFVGGVVIPGHRMGDPAGGI